MSWSTLASSCVLNILLILVGVVGANLYVWAGPNQGAVGCVRACVRAAHVTVPSDKRATPPAHHPRERTYLRVDREAAVELLTRLGRQPLRELFLEHDHRAAEHGPVRVFFLCLCDGCV